jgi:uncharacterized protein with PQ loop repeat
VHNVSRGEAVAAVANGWSAVTAAGILVRCYRWSGGGRRARVLVVPVVVGLVDVVVVLSARGGLGWVAAVITMVQFVPQALAVFVAVDNSGVSVLTWWLAVVASVLWGAYGLLHHDAAVVAPPVLTGSLALVIVCRLLVQRRQVLARVA